jgi:hypothetical protein
LIWVISAHESRADEQNSQHRFDGVGIDDPRVDTLSLGQPIGGPVEEIGPEEQSELTQKSNAGWGAHPQLGETEGYIDTF